MARNGKAYPKLLGAGMAKKTTGKPKSTRRAAGSSKPAGCSTGTGKKKAAAPKKKTAGARKASSAKSSSKTASTAKKPAAKKPTAKKAAKRKATSPAASNVKSKSASKQTLKAAKSTAATKARGTASPAPPATSVDLGGITLAAPNRKLPKTRLTPKQLQEFQDLLLAKRSEVAGDVEQLTDVALSRKAPGGASTGMPIHMADIGSDNWEQEFTLGLIASERNLVREIDEALERIQNRTYGICLATHRRISVARLRAKPWAKYCIEYARLRDEGKLPNVDVT